MKLTSVFVCLAATVNAALQYKGVDWSSLLIEEAGGKKYQTSAGASVTFEALLKANGVNSVRQRLWVKPADGNYNLAYNVKLGQRAKAAGLKIFLDLHYSDSWADPAHQTPPSGWPTDIENLAWKVYNHTLEACNAFAAAGIPLDIVSIGNEITTGLLWPLGKTNNFYNIARLLQSASAGIKFSNLSTKPKILIHLDNGWKWETQKWWYTSLLAAGPFGSADFDIMGVSYYPFYDSQATLANLRNSLGQMSATFGKQVMIAETNWPASCPSPQFAFPGDTSNIPKTIAGQTTWIKEVANVVASTNRGLGLYYWEPAWTKNAGLGSSCWDNLLVEYSGKARASFAAFNSI